MYGSVANVKLLTGLRPEDFDLDAVEFNGLVELCLEEATDFINSDRNRDYDADGDVPKGINSIANRLASNMLQQAVQRRDLPTRSVDDSTTMYISDKVFTKSIREDLRKFPFKSNISFMRVGSGGSEDD